MSNLRIHVDNSETSLQQAAPAACGEAPPQAPPRGPRTPDACHLTLPLTLDAPNPPPVRQVVFDRQGDQFVLSPQNSADTLTWVGSQQDLPSVLSVLRLTGNLLRGMGRTAATDRFYLGFFLWMSRYLVTGRFQNDSASSPVTESSGVSEVLLDFFSGSRASGLAPIIGNINVFRREAGLSEQARERIQALTGILDLVPRYTAFIEHFIPRATMQSIYDRPVAEFESYARIFQFIRRVVIALSQNRPLRFDAAVLDASHSYQRIYARELQSGQRPDFCAALEAAVQEFGGTATGANFLNECREAMELAQRAPEDALRESFRRFLMNPIGLQRLQQAIAVESHSANMRVDWLRGRSSFGQVFDAVLSDLQVQFPTVAAGEGAFPRLTFNISQFQRQLRMMSALANQGEYDLVALAFLRRLFGNEGSPPPIRIFANGAYQEVAWRLSESELRQARALIASLQLRRRSRVGFSEVGLPAIFGTSCALGVGGLVLSQTLPAIRNDDGLRLGTGVASSAVGGAGCFGLAGHYLWPAVLRNRVHNRYAWDLGSSAVGSGLGIGAYLLFHFLNAATAPGSDRRFPVDPYGP